MSRQLDLLTRKGIYPYEYIDSAERFKERSLPPRECFYSSLTEEDITEEEFDHAQNVWREFEMESLENYHDVYLLTDVLLLADVFEEFRKTCLNSYGLDPVHFYTAPGLSWKAALKMTKVKIDLLTDIDQHLFIEEGIRGGVAMICHRYAFLSIMFCFVFFFFFFFFFFCIKNDNEFHIL